MSRDLTEREREWGGWLACEEPERPFDSKMYLHPDCRACAIKQQVMVRDHPGAEFFDETRGVFFTLEEYPSAS